MFTHVAVFRWVPGTTSAQVADVTAALRTLPAAIPELRSYSVGPDAGLVDGNWDYAVVAIFDGADDWRTYTDHPSHQQIIHDLIVPIRGDRAAVQFAT